MTHPIVQQSKTTVWNFWQRCNQAPGRIGDLLDEFMDEDILWQGPHPFNNIQGRDALYRELWQPLLRSFPDLHKRTYLFLGGQVGPEVHKLEDTQDWVAGMGDYIGTFAEDFLGIPATGQTVHFRFGEFSRLVDGKIVEIYTLFDIISLMKQAGVDVVPPSPGREIWVPGPMAGNGVLLEPQDEQESQKSFQVLYNMLFKGMQYDKTDREKPGMEGHWTEDMVWYGPSGIGSAFGMEEFYRNAQGPIVAGHPDRIGGFHKARFGEGHCAAMGGLRALQGTHTGEFMGIAPTGNRVEWRIMDFYTRRDDLLHEDWVLVDLLYACLQIGVDLLERVKGLREAA
ncbi:ester cyclase [Pseudomaricurvus alkylphenolicus]|uniref:ester cyclase n=1 Tax=Pseudomaricurvus alkylphenolicus TaxID=1306991 RepID=UPI00141F3848|nr:ester cyclase [Pseudomaricurvus alkylphenolicus]NIB40644.1 ester cyclase [Pseudomaricurvus alkylphenolicus]